MAMLEQLPARVNANTALVRRGRYVNLTFLLGIGERDYLITISEGRVVEVRPRRLATATGRFTIRASGDAWREHWQAMPQRDYHDIWSMLPKGYARIDGDLLPLMQNLQYFKDLIASLREQQTELRQTVDEH